MGLKAALDIFLPRICLVCGRKLLLNEAHICLHCLADMPQTHFWSRSHNPMADRFNELSSKDESLVGERYSYASALFFFEDDSPYRQILYDIKYNGNIAAGRYFGSMLGGRIGSSEIFSDVDIVVPVPLHWRRKWKRGYNQAEVIAGSIAAQLGVPLRADLLRRTRHTGTQTKLEIEAKKSNVLGAFEVSAKCISVLDPSPKHILLVDDVFTTGSTLFACFKALRSVFPPSVRISVATLGFVGEV